MRLRTPFADRLPPLSTAEREALAADIAANGVRIPIEIDEDGNILDGHNRYAIAPDAPTVVVRGLSPAEKEAYVVRANTARRNLSPEQKAALRQQQKDIAFRLRAEDPKKWTQAAIATALGIDQGTASRWLAADISNMQSHNANVVPPPDARLSVPREARREIVERIEKGEPQAQVAADYGITQPRVSQIARTVRREQETPPPVETPGFPTGPFRTLVIDPPWPIEKIVLDRRPVEKEAMDYATLSLDEIRELPVARLADERGAHVYLWVTHKFLPFGLELFAAWGVRYECTLTWVKPTAQPLWWKYNTEHALFGKVASLAPLVKGTPVGFTAPQQRHSHKPEQFFDIVRRVSPEPRITLFDGARKGFVTWGVAHRSGDAE